MSNNSKVKGLLKGLRFISQIFETEKEPEIEIGLPTDVKHVAHIGVDNNHYDNSSVTLMNGLESIPRLSSASVDLNEDIHSKRSYNSERQVNEDSSRGGSSRHVDYEGNEREFSRSRRQSTGNMRECQAKEKSDKPRQQKKPSKHHSKDSSSNVTKSTEHVDSFQLQENNSSNNNLPPKKCRSKPNSKDGSVGGRSDPSKSRAQTKDHNDESSHYRSKHKSFEKDAKIETECNENIFRNYPN
ncbi:hypothetical protein TanjilG_28346 [Lupinus angustifolius]|uniref:CRIB domain-containing protein n=1 Tax=Lupinus angustifolius TaxID=3871 RepID=A0A4P1RI27_LUPAN|nr:PREDICTED: CRIB domain-containing protein RIC6-like [Lupinus angustifolius]OIW11255.1 hypothetical protein TanjilG_28346 [Lupinus angustifolius]